MLLKFIDYQKYKLKLKYINNQVNMLCLFILILN